MQEELDSVLRKIKNRKVAGLDEIPPFDDILLRHCNAVYNQNTIDRWTKGCILPFPKKGDLGLAKRYNAYIHSGQDLQCSTTQLHRTENWEDTSKEPRCLSEKSIHDITIFDYLLNSRRCMCKKTWVNNIICRLLQGLWPHTQREDGANTTLLWPTIRNRRSHNDAI